MQVHNLIPRGAGTEARVARIIDIDVDNAVEVYDRMTAAMPAHLADGSQHPAVSNVAARTDGGIKVVDVWDSPESFGRFAEAQIMSSVQDLPPFEPRFVPIHNRIRGRSLVRT